MGILKGQTAARLILQTDIDFNSYGVSSCAINYKKPDGTIGAWTASQLTGGESLGKIYVDFSSVIYFDQIGDWALWASIIFTDTRTAPGDAVKYKVKSSP